MPVRAVLLDFDGVLADTENVHIVAWERTFARLGWDVAPEVCARAAEEEDRLFLAEVFRSREIEDGDVEGYVRLKQTLTRAMLQDAPRVFPGVVELARRLQGKARLAVVTTTWRENVEVVLASAGLGGAFEVIVAKEDAKRAKPDPEPYKIALKRLGVSAGSAVALEDSPTGLASARAAGVRVVAVGHRRPAGEWTAEAAFVTDLRETEAVVRVIGVA